MRKLLFKKPVYAFIALLFLLCTEHLRAQELTGHPRLFLTPNDLPQLRSWAVSTNPFYQQGIKDLAEWIMGEVASGRVPEEDNGGSTYSSDYTEGYAHVLAFVAMVEPNDQRAAQYRSTAIDLLMYVMNRAVLGVIPHSEQGNYTLDELRFRRESFSTSDRSRWIGQAFPLAVDWLYPYLTVEQKRVIRKVFLMWAEVNMTSYPNHNYYREGPDIAIDPSNYNSPVWLDLEYDPVHKRAIRYAMNNFFNAHIRNIVMMAAAFDPADDIADPSIPGDYNGRLREYREKFLHTWFYMTDYAYRYENSGGMSAEGGEYLPALGFPLQLMLALHTANYDPAVWGEKINIASNPHWFKTVPALLNSLPPKRTNIPSRNGWCYQPFWYGDGEHYQLPDVTDIFAPLALYAKSTNRIELLNDVKWLLAYAPPGSIEDMLSRVGSKEDMTNGLMNFMIFDPESANQIVTTETYGPSPFTHTPTFHYAHGPGVFVNRTSWGEDARWLGYRLGWVEIDHQHGDGNTFSFYRKGEWLEKERTAYGNIGGSSDYKNTLTIKRNTDALNEDGFQGLHLLRGAQLRVINGGDPKVLATSVNDHYFFVTGDATKLYHYIPDWGDSVKNLQHVSRSLLWIKPDYIVVYDRVESNFSGFKRFWLNSPDVAPNVNGKNITAHTPGGQQLFIHSILPDASTITVVSSDTTLYTGGGISTPEPYLADEDPFGLVPQKVPTTWNPYNPDDTITIVHPVRFMIEANNDPLSTRFLHTLEGADGGATAKASSLLRSSNTYDNFEGVVMDSCVALFPYTLFDTQDPFQRIEYTTPNHVKYHYISGLLPNTSYVISKNGQTFNIVPGNSLNRTDEGGVLAFKSDLSIIVGVDKAVHPKLEVMAYPNPASSMLNFGMKNDIAETFELLIYDVKGKLVSRDDLGMVYPGEYTFQKSLVGWNNGYYYYKFKSGQQIASGKIVVIQ